MPIWQLQSSSCRRYVPPKIDEIFKDLLNVFGIEDDILVVVYNSNGKEHDDTLGEVLQICKQVNLTLKKDKCYFKYTSVPCF